MKKLLVPMLLASLYAQIEAMNASTKLISKITTGCKASFRREVGAFREAPLWFTYKQAFKPIAALVCAEAGIFVASEATFKANCITKGPHSPSTKDTYYSALTGGYAGACAGGIPGLITWHMVQKYQSFTTGLFTDLGELKNRMDYDIGKTGSKSS